MTREEEREEWLEEGIRAVGEQLGDTIAEHRSETAAFGDSWPGAQIQISNMWAHLHALEAELADVRSGVLFY